jgi:hypothetical protein
MLPVAHFVSGRGDEFLLEFADVLATLTLAVSLSESLLSRVLPKGSDVIGLVATFFLSTLPFKKWNRPERRPFSRIPIREEARESKFLFRRGELTKVFSSLESVIIIIGAVEEREASLRDFRRCDDGECTASWSISL